MVLLVWCRVLVSVGRTRRGGRIPVACRHYHVLPAAELNTHTMIATVIFLVVIVGLVAYASYLKHQLKK